MFQFLIGSLEAEKPSIKVVQQEFQFLIGSLEASYQHAPESDLDDLFQFLIGSLEAGRTLSLAQTATS